MAREVTLPKLGQTMEEGTIVNTLVKVGDRVSRGDVLFEVETDKATLEVEAPGDGFVRAILIENGATVPVNAPILVLAEQDEEVSQAFIDSLIHNGAAPAESAPGHAAAGPETKVPAPADALRIVEADVRCAGQGGAAAGTPKYALGLQIPVNRLQKIVAEKMLWSKQNIPCFYLNIRADVTELVALRGTLNKTAAVKISFNDFIIKAIAVGLKHYPILTGQIDGDRIQLAETLDIGLAISTDEGLVAPIVRDCGSKCLADIASYCTGLIERTRSRSLSLDDLQGGCMTVSNLGAFGIDLFIPIVVPGQTSILGVGAIVDTIVPSDGNLLVRKKMNLTLSVDHKVVNGAEAAQFLDYVKKHLEHPETLVK